MTLSCNVGQPPTSGAAGNRLSAETVVFIGRTQVSVLADDGRAATRRRRASRAFRDRLGRLVTAVVAAAAVQAGAWQVASRVIGRETVAAGPAPAVVAVQARTLRPAVGAVDTPSAPAASPPVPPRPAARPVAQAKPAAPTPTAAPDGDRSSQRPFYEYREVDVAAEPVGEWNLDPAALDALATSRIVFTLFVGSDGTLLHCSVDEPDRLPAAARRSLADRLCDTAMRPARRGGVAVASRRRVELFTEGGL